MSNPVLLFLPKPRPFFKKECRNDVNDRNECETNQSIKFQSSSSHQSIHQQTTQASRKVKRRKRKIQKRDRSSHDASKKNETNETKRCAERSRRKGRPVSFVRTAREKGRLVPTYGLETGTDYGHCAAVRRGRAGTWVGPRNVRNIGWEGKGRLAGVYLEDGRMGGWGMVCAGRASWVGLVVVWGLVVVMLMGMDGGGFGRATTTPTSSARTRVARV